MDHKSNEDAREELGIARVNIVRKMCLE